MTFEEFFNKKRIDLVALKAAEPGLFAEFEKHFNQMGEKSFDHTKKYWFNKLRLQYHVAPEQKPEKVHLENRLAEQTIVETLTDSVPPPSTGFKPRFKPGMAKPAPQTSDVKDPAPEGSATITPEVSEAAATENQTPIFEQEKTAMQDMADSTPRITDKEENTQPSTPKPGFKPRFNIKTMATKPAEIEKAKPEAGPAKEEVAPAPSAETAAPKPGFKPRFNMKTMAPKPAEDAVKKEDEVEQTIPEVKPANLAEAKVPEDAPATPKVGFKPRFNAKTMKPKPPEE